MEPLDLRNRQPFDAIAAEKKFKRCTSQLKTVTREVEDIEKKISKIAKTMKGNIDADKHTKLTRKLRLSDLARELIEIQCTPENKFEREQVAARIGKFLNETKQPFAERPNSQEHNLWYMNEYARRELDNTDPLSALGTMYCQLMHYAQSEQRPFDDYIINLPDDPYEHLKRLIREHENIFFIR